MKKFLAVNFGCRVNSAEINQLSQSFVNQGYVPDKNNPDIILVNTCAVTKKGEYESLSLINSLLIKHPQSQIIATGCANLSKLPPTKNLKIINKNDLPPTYNHQIKDKFSNTNRYLLKIQTGCTAFCSYCIVPFRRPNLWSLPINDAIEIVNDAVNDGYKEVIITGINIDQYQYGLSNLVESLLNNTDIHLVSFGSIPINSIDDKFISLVFSFPFRISRFLHIPIQSGSDKILKLMKRNYTQEKIIDVFTLLVKGGQGRLSFGGDIIVGFPYETDNDFDQTVKLCQQIGFSKIHTFRYSPRPGTAASILHQNSAKISKAIIKSRSEKIRSLVVQST